MIYLLFLKGCDSIDLIIHPIYNDSALEKFMEYSKTNHRGRKKKETENPEE